MAFQIPAFIQGNSVHLPAGTFSIDGGCSGLHYVIIASAVSVLYGALFLKSVLSRILLLSLAIGLALLTNWIRVFTVIYAGHLTDMQHFLVVRDHYYFGWVLFIVAMVPFMLLARKIEDRDESLRTLGPGNARLPKGRASKNSALAAALCLGLFVVVSAIANLRLRATVYDEVQLSLVAPQGVWTVSESETHRWMPVYRGADAEALKLYSSERGMVSVYANLYLGQTQGKEAIGHENHVEGSGPWAVESERYRNVEVSAGEDWWVKESVLTSPDGSRRLLYFWYFVNERSLAHPVLTKLYYGFKAITGIPETGVQILSAECMVDCESGRQLIESWLAVYLPNGTGRLFDTIETVGP
jgi:EpsI family protein